MESHFYLGDHHRAISARLFQKDFPNTMEQELQYLLLILLSVENILLPTTVESLAL